METKDSVNGLIHELGVSNQDEAVMAAISQMDISASAKLSLGEKRRLLSFNFRSPRFRELFSDRSNTRKMQKNEYRIVLRAG